MYNNNHIKLIVIMSLSTLIIFPSGKQQITLEKSSNWQKIKDSIKINKQKNEKNSISDNTLLNEPSIKRASIKNPIINQASTDKTLHQKPLQQLLKEMHINFKKIVAYFLQAKNNVVQALRNLTNLQKQTANLNDPVVQKNINQASQALENLQLIQNDTEKRYSQEDINHAVEQTLDALSNLEQYKKEHILSYNIKNNIEKIQHYFNETINNIIDQYTQKKIQSHNLKTDINSLDFSSLVDNMDPIIIKKHPLMPTVEKNITQLSQKNMDAQGNGFETTTGNIQTPAQYIDNQRNFLANQLEGINRTESENYMRIMNQNCLKDLQQEYQRAHPDLDTTPSNWTDSQNESFSTWSQQQEQIDRANNFKIQYQIQRPQAAKRTLELLSRDLNNYTYVINSRGDGNCGYRAILISTYMQGLKNPAAFENLQNLIETKFINLFTKYDTAFQGDKNQIAMQLKEKMLATINRMKKCTNEQEIQNVIQNDTVFDYAMIMFERYAMADIMNREQSPDLMAFIEDTDIENIKNGVLTWREELDQPQTAFLAEAMNLTIHTVQRDKNSPEQIVVPTQSSNDAYILYMPGHYQILVPKTASAQNPLPAPALLVQDNSTKNPGIKIPLAYQKHKLTGKVERNKDGSRNI